MARPLKSRKIVDPPLMQGYKPFGIPLGEVESVVLRFEEFESFKLIDYLKLSQEQAADRMNVSRPTFTRIYNKALKAIALAFVEGRAIEIEGGNYTFEKEWYKCKKCFKLIQGEENHSKCSDCPSYGANELCRLNRPDNPVKVSGS